MHKQKGFTLVELMIVVGISGGLSLAIMSLLNETVKINERIKREVSVTQDSQSFLYTLEQYISQTTQVLNCRCTPNGAIGCSNPNLLSKISALPDSNPVVLFDFIFEDANNPFEPTSATQSDCLMASNGVVAGTGPGGVGQPAGVTIRGCKKRAILVFIPPIPETNDSPSIGGKLFLQVSPNTNGTPRQVNGEYSNVMMVKNVTSVACGMGEVANQGSGVGTNLVTNTDFKIRFDTKSQLDPTDFRSVNYDGFVPPALNGSGGSRNFALGTHRSFISQMIFRNATTPGIQFGKFHQIKDCIESNDPRNTNISSNEYYKCCTNYGGSGRCTGEPQTFNISGRGTVTVSKCLNPRSPSNGGVSSSNSGASSCCSQMVATGPGATRGLCL